MKIIYKLIDGNGNYLNSFTKYNDAIEEQERLSKVYPHLHPSVVIDAYYE